MVCPNCGKDVGLEGVFCNWCTGFVPRVGVGHKAGVARRWFAAVIDPALVIVAWLVGSAILGSVIGAGAGLFLVFAALVVLYLVLFARGQTFGKRLMGLQVVKRVDGSNPGVGVMLLREVIGKVVSALFLGIGFFWAIIDRDTQAWHDKIASTVVIRPAASATVGAPSEHPSMQLERE